MGMRLTDLPFVISPPSSLLPAPRHTHTHIHALCTGTRAQGGGIAHAASCSHILSAAPQGVAERANKE